MEASEILYRIEVTKYSTWRTYSLLLCAFVFLLTIVNWPYSLPFWLILVFFMPAVVLLFFTVYQTRTIALLLKQQYKVRHNKFRQRKADYANEGNYLGNEEAVILLTSVGDIQFRGITGAPIEGLITHQSFYLFGIYHIVVTDKLLNRSSRYVFYGDQMNEQGNRRLRRVINRVKHAPTEA